MAAGETIARARAQRDAGEFRAAAATFFAAAAEQPERRRQALEEAAACLIRAGAAEEGAEVLAGEGLIPAGVSLESAAPAAGMTFAQVEVILRVLGRAKQLPLAAALALAAWDTGDDLMRADLAFDLPGRLLNAERSRDALRVYHEAVELGLAVGDFRPRVDQSTLRVAAPEAATRLYQCDHAAFTAALHRAENADAVIWAPLVDVFGGVTFRGAVSGRWSPVYFIVTRGGDTRRIAATRSDAGDGAWRRWEAAADDLLPGGTYGVQLVPDGGAPSSVIAFHIPLAESDGAVTRASDAVGLGAVAVRGQVAAFSAGARYRFEYGAEAERLDRATAWADVPPPRTGRSVHPLYRQTGEWLPTCAQVRWLFPATGEAPALSIEAPFAKDRNQLTGIGAHEMPVGIAWGQTRDVFEGEGPGRKFAPIAGGVQDLRDAEVALTLAGNRLRQQGAALHFWISHAARDAHGEFSSQWALTGAPVPDDALMGSRLTTVTLRLPNDPLMWTYTGNNPEEQGDRANRYRRTPLDTALRMSNASSVLIFAFGDVRRPPQGALIVSAAEMRYRDHSLLSRASGAALAHFPEGSVADPLCLTSGVRGDDENLWTSTPSASLPLTFRWALRHPATPTHFQINQHPYWPAREIEITAELARGGMHLLWRGVLAEARPDLGQAPSLLEYLPAQPEITAVTLRILSGYRAERCGLDGFEIYGSGAVFQPDGQACSVSEEIEGLAPGSRVFTRVVLEDGGERIAGEITETALPVTVAPLLLEARPLVRPADPACYWVRANAMGLETELWGELEHADGRVFRAPAVSLGSQPTGRHIYYIPRDVPNLPGTFRLHARNTAGSAVMTAPWPIGQEV